MTSVTHTDLRDQIDDAWTVYAAASEIDARDSTPETRTACDRAWSDYERLMDQRYPRD